MWYRCCHPARLLSNKGKWNLCGCPKKLIDRDKSRAPSWLFHCHPSRARNVKKSGCLRIGNRQRTIHDMLLVLQSRQNSIYFVASIDKGFKTITTCCLQHLKQLKKVRHFEETTHACAFCFCLGVPRLFVSDTSLKRIDRVGLGKRRTGTRQR